MLNAFVQRKQTAKGRAARFEQLLTKPWARRHQQRTFWNILRPKGDNPLEQYELHCTSTDNRVT